MDALLTLKMNLEGSGTFQKGLDDASASITEIETKAEGLASNLKSIDKMSMGELRREIRSLKNINIDFLSDDQVTAIETRMAMAMDAMGDKQQEMKARGMNAFETIAGGANIAAAGFETIVGAMSLMGVEGETMKFLESKMTSMIATVQGLSTVYSFYESGQLRSIGLNIRDMFITGKNAVMKLFYTTATGAATVATTMFGRALQIAMGPIGWIALAITALISVFSLLDTSEKKSIKNSEDIAKAKEEEAKKRNLAALAVDNETAALKRNLEWQKKSKDTKGVAQTLADMERNIRQKTSELLSPKGISTNRFFRGTLTLVEKARLQTALQDTEFVKGMTERMNDFADLQEMNIEETGKKSIQVTRDLQRIQETGINKALKISAISGDIKIETKTTNQANETSEIKALTVNITKLVEEMNISTSTISQNTPNTIKDEVVRLLQTAIADSTRLAY